MSAKKHIPLQHNESYWLLDDKLVEAYRSCAGPEFSTYPDYSELRERTAAYAGVRAEQVVFGAGSDALIESLARRYAAEGKSALLPVPTFYGYERIFARAGLPIDPVLYSESNGELLFPVEETVKLLASGKSQVLFLCQPNNPLGCEIPDDMFTRVLDAAAANNVLVVSDEAYFEFSGKTALKRLLSQPLIIVRTFSKGFGLSGARLGYCIMREDDASSLTRSLLPWPVAHASVFAALRGLELQGELAARVRLVIEERERFRTLLNNRPGLHAYQSATNFLLVRVPDSARALSAFSDAGIHIADTSNMSSVPEARNLLRSTIRLSVPSPQDCSRVMAVFGTLVDNA